MSFSWQILKITCLFEIMSIWPSRLFYRQWYIKSPFNSITNDRKQNLSLKKSQTRHNRCRSHFIYHWYKDHVWNVSKKWQNLCQIRQFFRIDSCFCFIQSFWYVSWSISLPISTLYLENRRIFGIILVRLL